MQYSEKDYEYRGQFEQGLFDGVGEERAGLQKYIGFWRNGEKNGVGFLRLINDQGQSKSLNFNPQPSKLIKKYI